jgi:hypothetical protein
MDYKLQALKLKIMLITMNPNPINICAKKASGCND